ncbi:MAG: hypothetical protein QOJ16_2828 [Acidobacteriota bacterium]|jgi:hypothetical protein|nr:hypothetical protein [Acidobacteriota bacterium]
MDRKWRAWFVILAGVATILFTLWLLPRAVRTARQGEVSCVGCRFAGNSMIRFELASSREEVRDILGPADTACGRCIRKVLDAENHADFGFMVSYSALNLAIVLFLAVPLLAGEPSGSRRLARILIALGIAGAFAMLLGDATENLALLRLTGPSPDFESALRLLYPATRLKWSTLAIESLLIAGLYLLSLAGRSRPGRFLALLGLLYLYAAFCGLRAVASGETTGYGGFFIALGIAWACSLLHAVVWLCFSRRLSPVPRMAGEMR